MNGSISDVIYEGEMKDGMFHGKGVLHYPNEGRVEGVWERGTMVSRKYMFPDRLEYTEDDIFPYLKMPDRRFTREMKHGIKPAGRSELTNDKHPRPIPEGCYDTGFAFYNPKTKCLTLPNTGKIVGVPTKKREEWIKKHCRKAWDENVGFRPDLYECWYDVREGSSSTSEKELVEQAFSDKSKVGKTPEEVFTTQVHQTVENMGLDLIGEDSLTEVSSERDIVWLHQEVRTNAKDDVHVDVAQKP
ncbi:MORN repeat-containing protein 5 [Periplaneta americana]|uniref:MORN repeat-containing protein 5 n=1 Tax=Periplaneta americana TaxID=6978 RepID=UPI0037E800AE